MHDLEILYTNCAYGIYQAAKNLEGNERMTNPIQVSKAFFTNRIYILPQHQLNRIRKYSKELSKAMDEYNDYIKEKGLPICDFTLYRKNATTVHEKFKRAMRRLTVFSDIMRNQRENEVKLT